VGLLLVVVSTVLLVVAALFAFGTISGQGLEHIIGLVALGLAAYIVSTKTP